MQNSKDQLIRVMTLGLVFGALLFILAAEVNHLKSSQESEEDDATIYIQEDGVTAVIINESSADSESGIITTKDEKKSENIQEPINKDDSKIQELPINFDHINLLITNMSLDERNQALTSLDLFTKIVESEANNRSALMAAANNQLNQHPNVKFMMDRSSENMLLEFYLNLLIDRKLPAEFPTDEQLIDFYESNKETRFTSPLRARIWQIFLSKSDEATEEEILELQQKAEEIVLKIKTGRNDFSNLAVSQSQHDVSRSRGGYMGVMEIEDLLPEIKEYILQSQIGQVSDPIETDSGLHIIKRGTILPEEVLSFEQAEDQVRQILINQTGLQLKNAIFDQARADYPQEISEEIIEEWWLAIKAAEVTP